MLEKTVAFLAGPGLPFPPSSLEYKQSSMFVFAVFVTYVTFGSYIVENMFLGLYPLARIQIVMFLLVLGAYIDFRRRYHIQRAMQLLIFAVSTVTLSALHFPGIEPYGILFWVAALPLFVFLLLGHRLGLRWSFINTGGIIVIIILSTLPQTDPLFGTGLLLQVLFGYLVVSAIAYYFEKQRGTMESRLYNALAERETLLKEVHHRVKNNMQVMMGLLWLQSEYVRDPVSSEVLLTNVDRLSAMAALHERLYHQENIQRINMQEYLEAIISHLQALTPHTLLLECAPFEMGMRNALQIGLITNEAVTNAMRHAFDGREQGEVRIVFSHEEGQCRLQISDNGNGMEETAEKGSLGSLLIRNFAEALPASRLQIETAPSVTLTLTFSCKADHAA